jgi:hypothetical protein
MKPIGNYNKLPKTFKGPEKLKPGQTITYKLHEDYKRIVPQDKYNGQKIERWPEMLKIPAVDLVRINYTDEKGEPASDFFDIGLIQRLEGKDGVFLPVAKPWWTHPNMSGGEITLTGGIIEDEERYLYAELCNYNGSNPNRDTSKPIYFYRVDREADAEKKVRLVDLELECLIFIKNLTPKEIKKLAASFQLNENEPVLILRDKLNDFARKDPQRFNNLATSKDVEVRATIHRAHTKEVIRYAPQQHKIVWGSNNSTIATLKKGGRGKLGRTILRVGKDCRKERNRYASKY